MEERYELSVERISQIAEDKLLSGEVNDFFVNEAGFLNLVSEVLDLVKNGELCKLTLDELRVINKKLYEYPFVESDNQYLSALAAEMRAVIPYIFEKDIRNVLIRMELFLEFYSAFVAAKDGSDEDIEPKAEELKDILYYYVCDYAPEAIKEKVNEMLPEEEDFATKIVKYEDITDLKTLYLYGEKITEVEEKTLEYLNKLPETTIRKMADTFTEGYRIGFEVTGKDINKKKLAEIRYHIGFEPVVKIAIDNFEKMGMKVSLRRGRMNLLAGRGLERIGFEGACPGRQFEFEHKDDLALVLDKHINTIRLNAWKNAFEKKKNIASLYGGPAVMEVFGEKPTDYVTKEGMPRYSDKQQVLLRKYSSECMAIRTQYILEEERSFTIIAFPTIEIGENFEKIFDEVIELNTLDYIKYRDVQQKIIDTLDKGDYVIIKGSGNNKTNIKVNLHELKNLEKETNFENCVADVNIPVGEVFTSPVLSGTDGVLHVSRVFLEGLEYKNLKITVKDGMITEYSLDNFPTKEENERFFKDNVLYHHESLPIGEFAIGTNTTAYAMAKKYDIGNILPILIAEKTGPHFAFGDTCYSRCEDTKVYNPDGKEIIARENEKSALRNEDPMKAYFDCHTDITLPFDELSEISVVTYDNEVITIIEDGRFVLEGTDFLNEPLG